MLDRHSESGPCQTAMLPLFSIALLSRVYGRANRVSHYSIASSKSIQSFFNTTRFCLLTWQEAVCYIP